MTRPRKNARSKSGWPCILAVLGIVAFVAALWSLNTQPGERGEAQAAASGTMICKGLTPQALAQGAVQDVAAPPKPSILRGVVRPGDTASGLFAAWMSPAELASMARACKDVYSLRRLRPGRPYAVSVLGDKLVRFEYEVDGEQCLVVASGGDGFQARLEPIAYETQTVVVEGRIESSLIQATVAAGEEESLALALADIFAWDVDFCRDLRPGDTFSFLVQKRYRQGTLAGYGPILAASFVNQGNVFEGFRFPDDDDKPSYFDAEGKSLRKVLLKAPLSFRRISSGFSHRRFHPILKYYRPHTGVDYAAPHGTPVWSVGDGVVVKRGRTKAAGNYIRVRHNSVYTTQYCHLSRFARGAGQGAKVAQGQVIGYVGSTGYATGPHLDFRLYYRGKPIDPRKVKAPSCKPVPAGRMEEFNSRVYALRAALESGEDKTRLAEISAAVP